MTVQTWSNCGIPELLNNFVRPGGQWMECAVNAGIAGERSAEGGRGPCPPAHCRSAPGGPERAGTGNPPAFGPSRSGGFG